MNSGFSWKPDHLMAPVCIPPWQQPVGKKKSQPCLEQGQRSQVPQCSHLVPDPFTY